MSDHIEDAISRIRTAAVAIQALARVMAEGSDHPAEAHAIRQLAVQIEDTLTARGDGLDLAFRRIS